MKYIDEFNDPELAKRLLEDIHQTVTQPWAIMEVCGGQTHSILHGIDQLLPEEIELIHGPGCPVCVTPLEHDRQGTGHRRAAGRDLRRFGDMLRVPGSETDLFRVKSEGGDVRIVYSPLDAVQMARENPTKQVVFFGIGFETTAPANAMAVHLAKKEGLKNFSMLVSHVLVPPAIDAIMSSPGNRVQAFLAAGHVCSVMGFGSIHRWPTKHHVPIVITGFEPLDVLEGIRRTVQCTRERRGAGGQRLRPRGDLRRQCCRRRPCSRRCSHVTDRAWRGIGVIPQSGWRLSDTYRDYDAEHRFDVGDIDTESVAVPGR